MLLIACPSRRATESTTNFPLAAVAFTCGIVFVTIMRSIGDCSIRSMAGPDSTPWTAQARTERRPVLLQRDGRLGDRPGRVDDVVLDDARAPVDVADDVHHLRRPIVRAPLVDHRQLAAEALRIRARPFGAARVGRDQRQPRRLETRQMVDDHRRRKQMVDRNVKEPLNPDR